MAKFGNLGKGAAQKPAGSSKFNFADLDRPELQDYSGGQDGIPWIDNKYIFQLVAFEMYEGYKFQGPRATFLIRQVESPDVKRVTEDGKEIKPAEVGEERPFYFRVNEGMTNGFDIGENARKQLANMAAALNGFDSDSAKEALAKGEFSVAGTLEGLSEATEEEVRAAELTGVLEVRTRTGKKVNQRTGKPSFIVEYYFHPLESN